MNRKVLMGKFFFCVCWLPEEDLHNWLNLNSSCLQAEYRQREFRVSRDFRLWWMTFPGSFVVHSAACLLSAFDAEHNAEKIRSGRATVCCCWTTLTRIRNNNKSHLGSLATCFGLSTYTVCTSDGCWRFSRFSLSWQIRCCLHKIKFDVFCPCEGRRGWTRTGHRFQSHKIESDRNPKNTPHKT